MNEIDDKKILEFCGWKPDPQRPEPECWLAPPGKPIYEPDIYSLDWQKEYLWPKIGLSLIKSRKEIKVRARVAVWDERSSDGCEDDDPATAILKAVMSLLNGVNQ